VKRSALQEAVAKELGGEENARFSYIVLAGVVSPEIPGDAFGPCFTKVNKKLPRYELGLDPASATEKKVRGLVAKSAAAKAGLAEGERITAADLGDGTLDKPVELELERGGKLVKVRYLPRGEAVDGFSWTFAPKAPASCGAPRR
jgi:hypothetical protein